MPIGFPQTSGYFPLPTCSVIKFKLDPATQSKYYCEGKQRVLTRYTLTQDYTPKNVTGKVFHQFTNSPLPNQAHCFYDRQKTALNGNRKKPIKIFEYCNLPNCTCQLQQPHPPNQPPQPSPYKLTPYKPTPYKPTPYKPTPYKPIPYKPTPYNQPPTNQPPTNPIPSTSGDGGQTQNQGGAQG